MRSGVYQCDVCHRHLEAARIVLFQLNWPMGAGGSLTLRGVVTEWTSGTRCVCRDCLKILADLHQRGDGSGDDQEAAAEAGPRDGAEVVPDAEPPGGAG